MKSMPASSAMRASRRQSGQLPDHLSATLVAERPDEQLAPNSPIFNALALYMAVRAGIDAVRANGKDSFNSNSDLILRRSRSDRLEGWRHGTHLRPSFEMLASQAPQDEVCRWLQTFRKR